MENDESLLISDSSWNEPNFNSTEYVTGLYSKLMTSVWIIKLSLQPKEGIAEPDGEQYISGVCIGSAGYIVTSTKALTPISSKEYRCRSIYGRNLHYSGFMKLDHVLELSSNLTILKVKNNTTKYHYVNVNNDLRRVRLDSSLLVVGHEVDTPFTFVKGHVVGPIATLPQLVPNKACLPDAYPYLDDDPSKIKYIPLQGMVYRDLFAQYSNELILYTSIGGSAVFDVWGKLVGLISMGVGELTFAVPIIVETLVEFEEYLVERKNEDIGPSRGSRKKKTKRK